MRMIRGMLDELLTRLIEELDDPVVTVPTANLLGGVVEVAERAEASPRILTDTGIVAEVDWHVRARLSDLGDRLRETDVSEMTVRGDDRIGLVDVDESAAAVKSHEPASDVWDGADTDPMRVTPWSEMLDTVAEQLGASAATDFRQLATARMRGRRVDPVAALLWVGARNGASVGRVVRTAKRLGVGGESTVSKRLQQLRERGLLHTTAAETETVRRPSNRLQPTVDVETDKSAIPSLLSVLNV